MVTIIRLESKDILEVSLLIRESIAQSLSDLFPQKLIHDGKKSIRQKNLLNVQA